MQTAKLFANGNSQAVRLPKKFNFTNASKVYIHKCGNKIILEPIMYSWDPLLKGLEMLPNNVNIIREKPDHTDDKQDLF